MTTSPTSPNVCSRKGSRISYKSVQKIQEVVVEKCCEGYREIENRTCVGE